MKSSSSEVQRFKPEKLFFKSYMHLFSKFEVWNWLRETFRLELSGVGMLSEWPHALALGIRQIQRFSKK